MPKRTTAKSAKPALSIDANPIVEAMTARSERGAVKLVGYIGKDAPGGKIRLYHSLGLHSWIDVSESDVVWYGQPDVPTIPATVIVGCTAQIQISRSAAANELSRVGSWGPCDDGVPSPGDVPVATRARPILDTDSVGLFCMSVRGQVNRLVDEYKGASGSRRGEILTELTQLGKAWNAAGCRGRYGDITRLAVSDSLLDLPQLYAEDI